MAGRHDSQEIDDAAADWVAMIDRGLTVAEQVELDAWAAADPRRRGALARMLAVMAEFGASPAYASPRAAPGGPRAIPRRYVMFGGGAIAASVAGAAAVLSSSRFAGHRLTTRRGEVRAVALEDGSVLRLDTDSALLVSFASTRRDVRLLNGEAIFDVAKDAARPFVVHAGGFRVRAVGTSFSVRRLPGSPLEVMVSEGVVEFGLGWGRPPVRLGAGAVGVASADGGVVVLRPGVAAVLRAQSWRDGMLDLDGVTLAEASRMFARYSDRRIVVDDPAVGRLTVSGRFSATDPAGFARVAAVGLGLRARSADDGVHLGR